MPAVDFYYFPASPPCRATELVGNAVGVNLNKKLINLMSGETMTPEFIKMNPMHAVPTIDDDGFILTESRAIMGYFVDQYAKDDDLYPKDPTKRAVVNQRLYFDIDTLYSRFKAYFVPVIFLHETPSEEHLKKLEEAIGVLETFLEGMSWVAGEDITIADYAIAVTICTMEAFGVDISKFPNVSLWYTKAKSAIPDFEEINKEGLKVFSSARRGENPF